MRQQQVAIPLKTFSLSLSGCWQRLIAEKKPFFIAVSHPTVPFFSKCANSLKLKHQLSMYTLHPLLYWSDISLITTVSLTPNSFINATSSGRHFLYKRERISKGFSFHSINYLSIDISQKWVYIFCF